MPAQLFDSRLQETLVKTGEKERHQKLLHWDQAPGARAAHPREDHLIPLMAALGAAEKEPAALIYEEKFMDTFAVSSYRFGT